MPTANSPEANTPLEGAVPAFFARHRRALLAGLLLVGVLCTVGFGIQGYHALRRLYEGTQPIVRPWMTIPRISRQFQIPEADLYRALDVAPQRPDPRPLDRLAREKGLKIPDFVDQAQRFVDSYRPTPTPTAWRGHRYVC